VFRRTLDGRRLQGFFLPLGVHRAALLETDRMTSLFVLSHAAANRILERGDAAAWARFTL
jgi:hypothetical protein